MRSLEVLQTCLGGHREASEMAQAGGPPPASRLKSADHIPITFGRDRCDICELELKKNRTGSSRVASQRGGPDAVPAQADKSGVRHQGQ